jgi:hypothetical protein
MSLGQRCKKLSSRCAGETSCAFLTGGGRPRSNLSNMVLPTAAIPILLCCDHSEGRRVDVIGISIVGNADFAGFIIILDSIAAIGR